MCRMMWRCADVERVHVMALQAGTQDRITMRLHAEVFALLVYTCVSANHHCLCSAGGVVSCDCADSACCVYDDIIV